MLLVQSRQIRFKAALIAAAVTLCLGNVERSALGGLDFRGSLLIDDYNGSNVLAFDPADGSYKGVFATMTPFSKPAFMALGPNGNVYVSDYAHSTIVEFDGKTGSAISGFNLQTPDAKAIISGLTFDPSGHLYATDSRLGTIEEYDSITGDHIKTFATGINAPRGLTYSSGHVYVTFNTPTLDGGIASYDLQGNLTSQFGRSADYLRLQSLSTGANGNLFATDGESSVYQFTPSGTRVGVGPFATSNHIVGTYGAGFGPNGSLFVVDTGGPVYKFDSNGNLLGDPFIPKSGADYTLNYPVSALYDAVAVPEPGTLVLTCSLLGTLLVSRIRLRRTWLTRGR